jgi:hypothetical protein
LWGEGGEGEVKRRERQRDGLLESAGERERKGSPHGEECVCERAFREAGCVMSRCGDGYGIWKPLRCPLGQTHE